mgnify:CR=1 FL=1
MPKQNFKKRIIKTYTNSNSDRDDKIDTSFLIERPIYDNRNNQNDLNSILLEDLNEVNDELIKLKDANNFEINDNDILFSFNDSLLLDDLDKPTFNNRRIIEDEIMNYDELYGLSETDDLVNVKRKQNDKSIYDDIKELEILYSTFKKEIKR